MSGKLETRVNAKGYREFREPSTGEWRPVHRRVAEKKWGEVPEDRHVHHRDGDKANNSPSNLLYADPRVHARLHSYPDACARCGREGHWTATCRCSTYWDGRPLPAGR